MIVSCIVMLLLKGLSKLQKSSITTIKKMEKITATTKTSNSLILITYQLNLLNSTSLLNQQISFIIENEIISFLAETQQVDFDGFQV